jgi:hypothetical protein
MNTCRRIKDELVAFLGGELEERKAEEVRTHLKDCPLCRRELQLHRQVLRRAEALNPELDRVLASVDWEAQAEKTVRAVWQNRPRPLAGLEPRPTLGFPLRFRPILAGLLLGIMVGALAMFIVFRGAFKRNAGGPEFFASQEFLDRADLQIARRETVAYLEKSQYVLLELAQPAGEQEPFRLSEAAARQARELLSKKKFLNPQLEKIQMAKAKDICDQIELLFYELSLVSESLSDEQRREIQSLIEQKNLLLKIKLLKKELQESEV